MKAIVLNGDECSQKLVLQACVPFVELNSKAIFTYMTDPSVNPYQSKEPKYLGYDKYYQRRIDEDRIRGIKRYIRQTILDDINHTKAVALFPTALLISITDENTKYKKGQDVDLTLTEEVYVVDGQHRLKGMQEVYKDVCSSKSHSIEDITIKNYLEDYKYNCTILLNFDIWEQAQIFAEVNFNQKKVNKSLYYSIYGMHYQENSADNKRNSIYIAHQLVTFINTFDKSPLKGYVKMLGSGKGVISQACLAESIIANMASPQSIWYVDWNKVVTMPKFRYMSIELISFWSALERVFHDIWPKDLMHNSIICKTTGVGALMRYMGYMHSSNKIPSRIFDDIKKEEKTAIYKPYLNYIEPFLYRLKLSQDNLFGLKGDYSGTGGRGLENKLYKKLCELTDRGPFSKEEYEALLSWLGNPKSTYSLNTKYFNDFYKIFKSSDNVLSVSEFYNLVRKCQPNWKEQNVNKFVDECKERLSLADF